MPLKSIKWYSLGGGDRGLFFKYPKVAREWRESGYKQEVFLVIIFMGKG